ncbi:peptidase S10 [Geomonas sp. Red32]|nr:peptidase S10 [Geomonas sp. Red32]
MGTVSAVTAMAATPGDGKEASADKGGARAEQEKPLLPPTKTVVTSHRAKIAGKEIAYRATAGTLPVLNDNGETDAEIFYTAYTVEPPASAKRRPLLFVFNGGPGAASVWLHLGAIGPRRVVMLPDGNMPAPPFTMADNDQSWLDFADLVFVDPVGTGYSRAVKPDGTKKYAAVRADIESLAQFVRFYMTRNQRWGSPVFLVGESYGTFRCAGLSERLVEHGLALNGMILISTVLNMQTISFDNGNDLPYELYLPSYTATAWYHGKLAPDLQKDLDATLAAAEEWAGGEYLSVLNKGDRLTPEERRRAVETMARFTGLSPAFIDNRNLRIDQRIFATELLRDRSRIVGIMDSRLTADNVVPAAPHGFDPTITTIRPPFTSMINKYLGEELSYQTDIEYFSLGGGIPHWDWEAKNSYADTSDNLANTMAKNPYMKVMTASGYFDLATPHMATSYTMSHLGLTPDLKKNITMKHYRSGHMMYLELNALEQLKKDAADFVGKALK